MKISPFLPVVLTLASLAVPTKAVATDYTFIGGSGLVWSGTNFWSPSGAPLTAADNVVGNTSAAAIAVDGHFTFGDLSPTLTGWLIRGSGTVNSSLTMDEIIMAPTAATMTFNFANNIAGMSFGISARQVSLNGTAFAPTINFGSVSASQGALTTLNISEGVSYNGAGNANFVVANDFSIGLISYSATAGTKTMNLINSGSFATTRTITAAGISGTSSSALSIRTNNGAATAFTQTGTLALNVASGSTYLTDANITNGNGGSGNTMALVKDGDGTQKFISTGGSFTGGTRINAGTLLVNNASGNAIGVGNIVVGASGTLGGTGFMTLTAGNTLTVSGAISPGDGGIESLNIANDVIWNGGQAWKFELGAPTVSDQLLITAAGSDLLKGSGSAWTFDFQNTGVAGTTYTLIDWTGTTTFVASDFGYTGLASGVSGTFVVNGSQLDFVTVPEPASAMLLGAGLLTVVIFRRRRA